MCRSEKRNRAEGVVGGVVDVEVVDFSSLSAPTMFWHPTENWRAGALSEARRCPTDANPRPYVGVRFG